MRRATIAHFLIQLGFDASNPIDRLNAADPPRGTVKTFQGLPARDARTRATCTICPA